MQKVTLLIENPFESKTVTLADEITIGRTDASQIILNDSGLSRQNTTFFRDGEQVLVVDENSTNGTFLNGERIGRAPVPVFDGDRLKIGSETQIRVEIGTGKAEEAQRRKAEEERKAASAAAGIGSSTASANRKPETQNRKPNKPPMILIVAGASTVLILFLGLVALIIARNYETGKNNGKPTPGVVKSAVIPVRVIDPLGGEDPDDISDIIAGWEIEEKELDVATVQDVKVIDQNATKDEAELTVTAAFLAEQKRKAMEPRANTGIRPAGLNVPKELFGDGVIKQKIKLNEMIKKTPPYQQPLDFSDLAAKRLSGELLEMPMAKQSFYLEVGGSAQDTPFTAFSFETDNTPILSGSQKHKPLADLAAKYGVSLDNAADRKQIRMRLLRMFNPKAKPVLEEVAGAYFQKFGRPLRVTSLTRSMDYQILLNATNANSFKVRGAGSLPPHTSGCAFDLARKHMSAEEQNFVMEKLAQMERERKLDALIEYGTNACFHIFIYFDGIAPGM